tara:strand:- start:17 stop:1057 length:1041 start_codon:yes stop_codon:yes gene_type:complete
MLNRISKKSPLNTHRYHKTKNVFDFGNTGIDDNIIATKKAIVEVNNGSYKLPDTNSKVIFNETKGKILAVLGSEYKLVTHLQSLNEFYTKGEFQKLLEKHPNYECQYWNSETTLKAMITFDNVFPITSDYDTGKMLVVIWNSIDGRSTFFAKVGVMRLSCLNGQWFIDQTNMQHLQVRAKKSSGFNIVRLTGGFRKSLNQFDDNVAWLRKLAKTPLSDLQVKNFLILLSLRNKKKDATKDNLNQTRFRFLYHLFLKYRDKEKMGSTAYALYQAVTDDSTRPNQEWLDTKTCNNVSSGRTTDDCQLQVIGRKRELEWLRAISVGYGRNLFFTSNDQYNNIDYTSSIE